MASYNNITTSQDPITNALKIRTESIIKNKATRAYTR